MTSLQASAPRPIRRAGVHRVTFCVAALYNILWGAYAGINPQWIFEFADMPLMRQPVVFACVGMVIGLYGVVYAEIARRPERGFLLAAVGLAGKVLGPIGLFVMIALGEWPAKTIWVIVTNDLIWWVPFGVYLVDSWPGYRDDLLSGWPFLSSTDAETDAGVASRGR